MREPSPEQLVKLQAIDFDLYVKALFDEAHKGRVHLDILDGLNRVDPFVLNQSPMFWLFTSWAHAQTATMYATKLFDRTDDAFPVPKFFYMARLRAEEFAPGGKKEEMLQLVEEGIKRYEKLETQIVTLIHLRNKMYAHISEELIHGKVNVVETTVLMDHTRSVLTEACAVLNSLTSLCRNAVWGGFSVIKTTDYRRVIKLLTEGLCREADERDEEYARFGDTYRSPRPRDCSKTKGETDGASEVA